jgi:hypothetical protein
MPMQNLLATRENVIDIGRQMRAKLPGLAKRYPPTASGRSEWTRAVWSYFQEFRLKYGWMLYPEAPPNGGKVKGEFLTDFALFDGRIGCRIACESEWGNLGRVQWAFDKLRSVKADLKILIFQDGHANGNKLSIHFESLFKESLSMCAHHHPGHEIYLFIQFDREEANLFLWEPTSNGPFSKEQIQIEQIK